MKKIYAFLFLCALFMSYHGSAQLSFNINTSVMTSCYVPGVTGTLSVVSFPPATTNFTWTVANSACSSTVISPSGSTVVPVSFPCCGMYTITCQAYNSSTLLATTVSTLILACAPSLTVTGASTICPGSSATLTANGAGSYTWTGLGVMNPSVVVTPTAAGCYTVTGTGTMMPGCPASAVHCVSVMPSAVPSVSGNTLICSGSSNVLSASGALSYTWSTGATTPSISVTSGTCYVVNGSNMYGCTGWNIICTSVVATPTLAITGPTVTCPGAAVNLTFTGAGSYSLYPPSLITGSSMVVYPSSTTQYSIYAGSPCTGSAVITVNTLPSPTVTISGTTTVCEGSSADLTASGASTYSWSTGASTSTVNVLPLTNTFYYVVGSDANGCIDSAYTSVNTSTACSIVWPGDANSDGVVDNTDVFEIGLAFSATGAPRSPASSVYTGQYATTWAGTVSSGKNKNHADCNGDGTVNYPDTLPIFNNYSLTHAFKDASTSAAIADISVTNEQLIAPGSLWNKADIILGTTNNMVNQIYGVAFDLNFDKSLIATDSAYIVYSASFLNASSQNVQFRKLDFANGKIAAASVRVNGTNASGEGKIGEFYYKAKQVSGQFAVSVSNVKKVTASGTKSDLNGGQSTLTFKYEAPVGLKELRSAENMMRLFPNPSTGQVILQSNDTKEISYTVTDLTGRELVKGAFVSSKTLDLSAYATGTYMIRFNSGSESFYKKLVIEK